MTYQSSLLLLLLLLQWISRKMSPTMCVSRECNIKRNGKTWTVNTIFFLFKQCASNLPQPSISNTQVSWNAYRKTGTNANNLKSIQFFFRFLPLATAHSHTKWMCSNRNDLYVLSTLAKRILRCTEFKFFLWVYEFLIRFWRSRRKKWTFSSVCIIIASFVFNNVWEYCK